MSPGRQVGAATSLQPGESKASHGLDHAAGQKYLSSEYDIRGVSGSKPELHQKRRRHHDRNCERCHERQTDGNGAAIKRLKLSRSGLIQTAHQRKQHGAEAGNQYLHFSDHVPGKTVGSDRRHPYTNAEQESVAVNNCTANNIRYRKPSTKRQHSLYGNQIEDRAQTGPSFDAKTPNSKRSAHRYANQNIASGNGNNSPSHKEGQDRKQIEGDPTASHNDADEGETSPCFEKAAQCRHQRYERDRGANNVERPNGCLRIRGRDLQISGGDGWHCENTTDAYKNTD